MILSAMTDLPSYDQMLVQARAIATEEVRVAEPPKPLPDLRWRNTAIIGGTALTIGLVGYRLWWDEGFESHFKVKREGGFSRGTEFHGIDKLGHGWFGYAASRSLTPAFQYIGNDHDTARRLSALTIWGAMGMVEILDGFSKDYKFSYEDFIANTIGAGLGYFMEGNPTWDDMFDFRFAYKQTPIASKWDPPGDYGGHRYWLMFKPDGVEALRDVPVLKYLEFGVGYGAPGVDVPDEWVFHDFALRRREVLWGVSLNMSRVISDVFYGGKKGTTTTQRVVDRVLDLWQHPAIAYGARDLDRKIPPPVCCVWPPP
jgi:hypothetical protein